MSDPVDPTRVLVLAVGVEQYEYGENMSLPGAAADAVRFVRWALDCGVPPHRVVLASSWAEQPPVELESLGVQIVEANQSGVENSIVGCASHSGELLMIFWCGHGVVWDDRRILFTSDANQNHMRGLDVDQILRYLRSDKMSGFHRQIILVDACANFVDTIDSNNPTHWRDVVRSGNLPTGPSRNPMSQFVLFSACQGQIAMFNKMERHALFSDTVLGWIEKRNAGSLLLATEDLTKHIVTTFNEFRDNGLTQQTPVSLWHRSRKGRESFDKFGGVPVSGRVQSALETSGMTVAQVQRVANAIVDTPMVNTPASRQRLFKALHIDRIGPVDRPELIGAVVTELAGGRAEPLLKTLGELAETEQERLAAQQVRLCWQRQEWIAPVLSALGVVKTGQVRAAYYRAVPTTDNSSPPRDLDEAMDQAAMYGRPPSGHVAVVHRLVVLIEHTAGIRADDTWFDLPTEALQKLRAEAAAARTESARLVVDLRNPQSPIDRFTWPSTATGHLFLPDTGWKQTTVSCAPTVNGAHNAIAQLLDWTYQHGIASFILGLVVPRTVLHELPEAWEFGDALVEPTPLWHDRPTVLHSAERLSTSYARALWQEKTTKIRTHLEANLPEVLWINGTDCNDPKRIRKMVTQAQAACFGLEFVTGICDGDLRRDPLIAMIAAGAPYVVWVDADPPDWQTTQDQVEMLAAHGDFAELPMRLHQARVEAGESAAGLRLIWDEPEALPPLGVLTGLSTGGKGLA